MATALQQDIEYYLEPIIFYVGGCLFRLPREYLVQASTLFLDMLQLPQPTTDDDAEESTEGSLDTKPIVLPETVTISAFRSLVRLLYAGSSFNSLTQEEWLEVLDISDMWDMTEIRTKAIEQLRSLLESDPTQRLWLAKKYRIDDWVQPAAETLVRRNLPLGNREFELLDEDTLIKIAAIRERCYPVFYDSDYRYGNNPYQNTSIGHWEMRTERGEVFVSLLDGFSFSPPLTFPQFTNENATLEQEGDIRDGEFYFEKVIFKVEDRLFRVSNRPFVQHSAKFRLEFGKRGFFKYDHLNPFVIEGASVVDFRAMLRLLFPPQKILVDQEFTSEQWASILRLSAKWEMAEVKELAIQKLQNMDFGSVILKLEMAKEVGVEQWFSSAVKTLITRSSPLTTSDCRALGRQELILQVFDLRERAHQRHCLSYYDNGLKYHLRSERGDVPTSCDISAELRSFS